MRMLKPLALFFLILCTIHPNHALDVIEETCNKTSYPTECVKFVKSNPKYSAENPVEIAIIMFNIMRDKAMSTSTKISKLLAEGKARPGTPEHQALQQCANSYNKIATSDFQRARASLPRGDAKVALDVATYVLWKVSKCEVSFYGRAGGDIRTPLTDENNDMTVVVNIAAAIVDSFVYTI
ncbi:unnamed protein product [Lathyrus oleraceus]|uniref:uncharacterized protein LOC127135942 n=1 Tax=Pisum sativum TaxID=3888 RepID=UPI001FC64205|nr:uncharacterized protein LOC127135942 [Pisum sativum]